MNGGGPKNWKKKMKKPKEKETQSPQQFAEQWLSGLLETARRALAVRGAFPNDRVKFKRIRPAFESVALIIFPPDAAPRIEIWTLAKLDALAARITTEEAYQELRRWTGGEE